MPKNNHLNIIVIIAFLIFIFSGLLWYVDFKYVNEVKIVSLFVILILYPVRYFIKKPKIFLDHVKLAMIFLWSANQLVYQYRIDYNETISKIQTAFGILTMILFAIWLFMEGIDYFSKEKISDGKKFKRRLIQKNLFATAALLVTLGAVFVFMHYPYGELMIYTGLGISVIWFFFDYIFKPKN